MQRLPILLIALFASILSPAQTTYTVETLPDPKQSGGGFVSNPDNIIDAAAVAELNRLAAELEQSSTAQVAIVLVHSIGEDNPKEFATRLFQAWGIGQADVDNGLLIFSVMNQRRTEFETGDGLEGVLPDVICYRIGMQELVPFFRQEQYGQGLIAALQAIKETLEDPAALDEVRSTGQSERAYRPLPGFPAVLGWYIIVNGLFHLLLVIWLIYTHYSKQELYDRYMAIRYFYSIIPVILFPIPFALLYFFLRWHLKRLRNHPRYSKANGKLMHKLNEELDDEFLEQGQITEEELGSVDYDVWVTDNREDVLILRYARRWTKYKRCPKCNYLAYYQAHSKVIRQPTYVHSGKKRITFECKNCHYQQEKIVILPKKQRSSSGSGGGFGGGGGGGGWGGGSSSGGGAGVSW